MKQHLFKIWFAALLCMTWPGQSEAEIIRIRKVAPSGEKAFHSAVGVTETVRWKKQKAERRKDIRGVGRKANRKGAIIAAIVLLSIGVIVFGGLGLIYLALAFELAGDSLATIGLIMGVVGLILGLLCLSGLIKQVKKLRKINRGEAPPENIPRRPPTKTMHQ